ncbi:FecR domain-containing protein [Rhodocytophaga aerolata]|uniref:FecR domain-containing protein n=1 Tax=Rhodocytophaga aerolata TaxID=455078 RepID=A0ABT8R5R3_9BACT|nr:FecR domain-containing protein [Rhodocytophaga aerolata]MDO1447440.1 FecR domain-containing protein [Rhodocytophaga aerolata]
MDHFQDFSEEELLLNESFHNWVKQANPVDIAYWEQWLAKYPEKNRVVHNVRNIILSLSPEEPDVPPQEVSEAWATLQQTLQARKQPVSRHRPVSGSRVKKWYAVAAVFAGMCISYVLIEYVWLAEKYIAYATRFGETKDLVLPDGSQVILNGNTQLKYKEKWDEHDNREVWLAGEAYFSITKAEDTRQIKFIVHTDKLDVEVLGTQFTISNRKKSTQVVLDEGKIKVRQKADTTDMFMQPGEMLKFCNTRQEIIKKMVNPQMYSSWKHKKMVFEETSIRELAERIEFTYGYHVLFADKELTQRKLTGTIPSDNLDVLLLTLSKVFDLDIRKEKNQIVIKSN